MEELSRYGKLLRRYKAIGTLRFVTKDFFNCSFEAVQYIDGAIRAQCYFPDIRKYDFDSLTSLLTNGVAIEKVSGVAEDDQECELSGELLATDSTSQMTPDFRTITMVVTCIATKMLVRRERRDHELRTLRFGITNLEFEGNVAREIKTETTHLIDRGILSLELPLGEARIERLPNYEETVKSLKALQHIEVTCEISLEVPQGHDINWAENVIDVICWILSLAKGTKITWIYLDAYDSEGIKHLALHKYAVTRPYAGTSASVVDPLHPEDIKELIEKGHETFGQVNHEYNLGYLIDSYLEAKRPHSYLESRGLAAVQAMELFTGKYAEKHNLTFIIDENKFNEQLNNIGISVSKVLEAAFGKENVAAFCGQGYDKLKSLNRRTFRQVLRQALRDFGIHISGQKLDALVRTRNALVHKGSFNTGDRIKEYYRIISTMDKVLLRMLGYEGYILDCERKWTRVKI